MKMNQLHLCSQLIVYGDCAVVILCTRCEIIHKRVRSTSGAAVGKVLLCLSASSLSAADSKNGLQVMPISSRVKRYFIISAVKRQWTSLSCVILCKENLVKSLSFMPRDNWRNAGVILLMMAAKCRLNNRWVAKISGKRFGPISSISLSDGALVSWEDVSKSILHLGFLCFSFFTAWCGR